MAYLLRATVDNVLIHLSRALRRGTWKTINPRQSLTLPVTLVKLDGKGQ